MVIRDDKWLHGGIEGEHTDSKMNSHVWHDRQAKKGGPARAWAAGKKGPKKLDTQSVDSQRKPPSMAKKKNCQKIVRAEPAICRLAL